MLLSATKDWVEDAPPVLIEELNNRYEELSRLEQLQTQIGTSVPELYGSIEKFILNPSSVSVETFKRMIDTDEVIGSGVDFLVLAMIARFGDYEHKNKKIESFVRKALEQMDGSWHANLTEMFSAEWAGFSVSEQVFKYEADFEGGPAFLPKKVVTYQPLTILFAVDRHGDLLPEGVYQYQKYYSNLSNGLHNRVSLNGFRPDLLSSVGDFPYPVRISEDVTYNTVKMQTDQVIHLKSSVTGTFNNPYGRSVLRRAYKNWVIKDTMLRLWMVCADRKGSPLLIGWADPQATVHDGANNGIPGPNARADTAMAAAFKNIHNDSFVVLPGRKGETYDIEAIQVQGDTMVFDNAIKHMDRANLKALLIPPLVFTGGDGAGSYALGTEHKKVFNNLIDGKLKPYKQGIIEQFISKIIRYNFTKEEWQDGGYGDFQLEEYDVELMEKLSNIYSSLTTTGYMDPTHKKDMDYVRDKMNMPEKKPAVDNPIDDMGGEPFDINI